MSSVPMDLKVSPLGSRRTFLKEFSAVCEVLQQSPDSVKAMIEKKFGTTSEYAVTEIDSLVVDGRFSANDFKYIFGWLD